MIYQNFDLDYIYIKVTVFPSPSFFSDITLTSPQGNAGQGR